VKQKVALTPMLSNMSLGGSKMIKKGWNWTGHMNFWPTLITLI
jgi:hypothetical protein